MWIHVIQIVDTETIVTWQVEDGDASNASCGTGFFKKE
jgi:hypothetical protein